MLLTIRATHHAAAEGIDPPRLAAVQRVPAVFAGEDAADGVPG